MKTLSSLYAELNLSIIAALAQMDDIGYKLLIIGSEKNYINLLSIGDIQRALISGVAVDAPIHSINIAAKEIASDSETPDQIQAKLRRMKAPFIPVVNKKMEIENIIFPTTENEKFITSSERLKNIPVVIMAGGKGTRLKPITNVIPKPLVPIGEKPIVQCIMDRFFACGTNTFLFSVNYKWEVIRDYFKNIEHRFDIEYFQEATPLGTAGSLSLMKNKLKSTFFISNCDIIIDDNYENIYDYHKNNKNKITIVGCLKSYAIPYGIMTRTEDGLLEEMKEKPVNTYLINTGMYILEPDVLDLVPDNEFFHITELIEKVKNRGERVGVFPVSEGSWKDIGEWSEYLKNYVPGI